jgi:hypothetical protein
VTTDEPSPLSSSLEFGHDTEAPECTSNAAHVLLAGEGSGSSVGVTHGTDGMTPLSLRGDSSMVSRLSLQVVSHGSAKKPRDSIC